MTLDFICCPSSREVQGVPDTVPEGGVVPPPLDSAWAESTRKKALLKLEKLDTDLKNYKGNSIKESIRSDGATQSQLSASTKTLLLSRAGG